MQTDIMDELWFDQFIEEVGNDSETEPSKDNRDIKTNLEVITQHQGLLVYVIASHYDYDSSTTLSCKKGRPISRHCYDVTTDSYIIPATDYCKIGEIPVNFQLRLKDDFNFVIDIPAPERVLRRYMTQQQIQMLDEFKNRYKKEFDFRFPQVLKAY